MTPPRHANKDCMTTEENVTISSSRITRQKHCRCGAAESSLVATQTTNQQKGGVLKDSLETTRIAAWWNLQANVTDDENEWRTAQWRTFQGGPRSRRQLASKKKALGMSERAKYVRELSVPGTVARRRGHKLTRSSRSKNISVDESKRDAAAGLCSVWLRHHVFRGGHS